MFLKKKSGHLKKYYFLPLKLHIINLGFFVYNVLIYYLHIYSCSFTYKENVPFLSTEPDFMLLK